MADSRKLVYEKYLEKADSRKLVLTKCDIFDLAKINPLKVLKLTITKRLIIIIKLTRKRTDLCQSDFYERLMYFE